MVKMGYKLFLCFIATCTIVMGVLAAFYLKKPASAPGIYSEYSVHIPQKNVNQSDKCYEETDYGYYIGLLNSSTLVCPHQGDDEQTGLTHYNLMLAQTMCKPGAHDTMLWSNVGFNFKNLSVVRGNDTDDFGGHDPRFAATTSSPFLCSCGQLGAEAYRLKFHAQFGKGILRELLTCSETGNVRSSKRFDQEFKGNTLAIARKDDHNPFFLVSGVFNAWIFARVLKWRREDTHVFLFDDSPPNVMEEFAHKILAPKLGVTVAREFKDKQVFFERLAMAGYETCGPLMSQLDGNGGNCYDSDLVKDFRDDVLDVFNMKGDFRYDKQFPRGAVIATVVSRRNYGARNLERQWLNENEVLEKMRNQLGDSVVIRSVDFVNMPVTEQIRIARETDILIGVHGAGLVHALWLPENSMLIEIFPLRRRRNSFRNICRYVGCGYEEFRGGTDVSGGSKVLQFQEWMEFYLPHHEKMKRRKTESSKWNLRSQHRR